MAEMAVNQGSSSGAAGGDVDRRSTPTLIGTDHTAEQPSTTTDDITDKEAAPLPDNSSDDGYETTADQDLAAHPSNVESVWAAETMSLPREVAFVVLVCMAQFATQFAFGGTVNILHIIGASYGITEPGKLSWLVAGYSLTVGTFILFSGRLGDAFGYKKMMLIGYGWFSLWSLVAGLSVYSSYVLHVFARVLQGIGPAICLPNALAILGAAYPPGHRKAMVFSLFGATAPGGSVIGMLVAAAWSYAWWPWAFWCMSIGLAGVAVAAYYVLPAPARKMRLKATSWREVVVELDLPGAVTGILALVLINFAWNQAPITGWKNPAVIATLILGFVFVGVFFYIEMRVAKRPLLPMEAFNGEVGFVLAVVSCGWATFGIWFFYVYQIVQEIRGVEPLLAVAWFCPVAVFGAIAAVLTGYLLGPARFSPAVVMTMALAAFTVGIVVVATMPVRQTYWAQLFVCLIIMPFGMDMSFPAATIILSNAVKKEHQGIAASLVNTVVNYSISLGLGFAGTVEVHVNNGGKTPEDVMKGFRGALYMGVGLSVLGLVLCGAFLVKTHWHDRRKRDQEEGVEGGEKNAQR
ncbi:major facilitator superfamily transporter [Coniochaeta ligniaria NRRL 30616]|uniref:Major facilitator superfamily transporter n=1 Tax=Coniochaeta ligniaria NRRL 30616 TaxID=1408157 RepID=A0A1J7J140_9PEZI|nr:major facilitator superfamily transporter [Coniochaeta ligniaria NRRL 30616]